MQVALCAVLVTSSIVAVRGLVRSLYSDFGFEPRNAMLVETVLDRAGYGGDAVREMKKRMIDAMTAFREVPAAVLVSVPPLHPACCNDSNVFTDEATDLRSSNAAADA